MSAATGATVVLLLVVVALVAGCAGDDGDDAEVTPTDTAPEAEPGSSLYDLRVGDCFSGLGRDQDVRVRPRPCARSHQAEVYGVVTLDGRRFPGADTLRVQAATACAPRFAAYTGEPAGPATEVAFIEVVPTLASWSAGDRTALCLALGVDGAPLRGTIAGDGEGA